FQQQEFVNANQRFSEALHRAQARGDRGLVSHVLYFTGRNAYHQAEYAKARPLLEESLRMSRELGVNAPQIALTLAFLGKIALAQGNTATAKTLLSEGLLI